MTALFVSFSTDSRGFAANPEAGRMFLVGLSKEVQEFVTTLDAATLRYWYVAIRLIAENPFPRYGYYSERPLGVINAPSFTYNYWISEWTSVSGETLFVFTSEFLADLRLGYAVDEEAGRVEIFSVREAWIYDP